MAALLSECSSAWRRGLQRMVGPWVARRLGLAEDWAAPASLSFVYDDDLAHLPIHYIALGAPVSMCAHRRCSRSSASLCKPRHAGVSQELALHAGPNSDLCRAPKPQQLMAEPTTMIFLPLKLRNC